MYLPDIGETCEVFIDEEWHEITVIGTTQERHIGGKILILVEGGEFDGHRYRFRPLGMEETEIEFTDEVFKYALESMTRNLSKESKSYLDFNTKEKSDIFESLGRAMYNEHMIKIITKAIDVELNKLDKQDD